MHKKKDSSSYGVFSVKKWALADIMWPFILYCSPPPNSCVYLCLSSNLLYPKDLQMHAYFLSQLCVCLCMCTQSCVSSISFQTKLFPVFLLWDTKWHAHACTCPHFFRFRTESVCSERRQFHFSSVILSYFLHSSSVEKGEPSRDILDTEDYVQSELGERSFVRHSFQPYCLDQYATIGSALSELRA